jgi:hypothetical protein
LYLGEVARVDLVLRFGRMSGERRVGIAKPPTNLLDEWALAHAGVPGRPRSFVDPVSRTCRTLPL